MPALMNDYLARCRYETSCSCLRNPDNNLASILTATLVGLTWPGPGLSQSQALLVDSEC